MPDAPGGSNAPEDPPRDDRETIVLRSSSEADREAIVLRSLCRNFGETVALRNFEMTVFRGDIHGFLGRNGAGKTTAIRILAGLIRADSGGAEIFGRNVLSGDQAVRRKAGFLVESPSFFAHLSGRDNLWCHALLMGGISRSQVDESLDLFGLRAAADRKVGGYSLGMRQRLGLAQAFLGDPEIIVLDEPAIGLDPGGVIAIREIIQQYSSEKGTTFLISSHTLGEMERLCSRLSIIDEGSLVAEGSLRELGASGRVTVRVDDVSKGLALIKERFAQAEPRQRDTNRIVLTVDDKDVPDLVRLLVNGGIGVHEVSTGPAMLEDLFLDLVGSGGVS